MIFRTLAIASLAFLAGCAGPQKPVPIFATVPDGELRWAGRLPVLILRGSPYDMGYQHGSLMRREVRESVKNILAYADRQLRVPGIGPWIVRRKLDRAWIKMKPFVPERYLEEMRGLADGAEIPLRTLQRVHALPDLTSVTCASSAVAGAATRDGRLIQLRNLDWAIQSGIQRYAVLLAHQPITGRPFVNIGWLGFMGVISGINRQGISVAEIGAETEDADLQGTPMPFLLRRVLEESDDLDQAVKIIQTGPRTVGYNYLFAGAKARKAVALETTHQRCALFWMDQEAIVRSDLALDPQVRDLQLACNGNPSRPGPESPSGGSAYEVRYRGQAELLKQFHGRLDPEIMMAIAQAIAPPSNLQSVVYAYPQIWVASAQGQQPAATGVYQQVNLEDLFSR